MRLPSIEENIPGYVPLVTESQGMTYLTYGSIYLATSGVIKIQEYLKNNKISAPSLANQAAQHHATVGLSLLKQGAMKILPSLTIGIFLYLILDNENKADE